MVGRIAQWKGQLVALRGFARAELPPGSTLVFFGSPMFGEHDYLDEIRMEIERLGLGDAVSLRGFVEDIGPALRRIDVLVHASLSPEPFGQVIVEGLAAGVPVVASAGGGPSEILTHGHDGLLYEAGNEAELAEMLRLLSRDRALRARLRENGYLRARDFSPTVIGPLVLRVYADLTGVGVVSGQSEDE
jgi:glycosyltransferase involved in cell wall biosynthesis